MKIDRRTLIGAAGASLATAPLAGAVANARVQSRKAKPVFVLVHGGGHGGWCWKRVSEPLRAAGHRVLAPSLTGLGDRKHLLHPSIDLDTHVTDIVSLLEYEELSNVILVGHSYGGMVITGVADRATDRIGHMVYLDAAHPRNGSALWPMSPSAASVTTPAQSAASGGRASAGVNVRLSEVVNGVELILFPNEPFIKGPLGVTDPVDVAWMMKQLTPHPLKCFTQPLVLKNEAAVHKLPTTDIWRSSILANHRKTGVEKQTWAQNLWEIDSPSHNLMITEAKKTTDMLLKIAGTMA